MKYCKPIFYLGNLQTTEEVNRTLMKEVNMKFMVGEISYPEVNGKVFFIKVVSC